MFTGSRSGSLQAPFGSEPHGRRQTPATRQRYSLAMARSTLTILTWVSGFLLSISVVLLVAGSTWTYLTRHQVKLADELFFAIETHGGLDVWLDVTSNDAPPRHWEDSGRSLWGTVNGKKARQGGGKEFTVPLYRLRISNESGSTNNQFVATRDTAADRAAEGDRTPEEREGDFGSNHEAPPGTYET